MEFTKLKVSAVTSKKHEEKINGPLHTTQKHVAPPQEK